MSKFNLSLGKRNFDVHNRTTSFVIVLVNSAFLTGNRDSRRVGKTNHDRCNFRRSRPRASVIYDRGIGDLTENRFELNARLSCVLEAAGPRGSN